MRYLAIDLGASSGRAVLGTLDGDVDADGGGASLRDAAGRGRRRTLLGHRADVGRDPARRGARSMHGPRRSARSRSTRGRWTTCRSTRKGKRCGDPYSYRDPRTAGRLERAIRLGRRRGRAVRETGIQFLSFNTLPQVIADIEDEPELVARTATRLLIAEYFLYRLSGRRSPKRRWRARRSWSTCAQASGRGADRAPSAMIASRWPRIVPSGTMLGPLLPRARSATA